MTTVDFLLVLVSGAAAGAFFGHLYTWRFARKLERLGITLSRYDALRGETEEPAREKVARWR
jgi:hypothetical protein